MSTYTFPERPGSMRLGRSLATGFARSRMLVTAATSTNSRGRRVSEVPASQMYYWSEAWQRQERIAEQQLARGEVRRFDDVEDLINWLRSDED